MTRFVITERVDSGSSAGKSPSGMIAAGSAIVDPSATGALYKLARLLGATSTLALIAGTNANLRLDASSGVISAVAAIGAGVTQRAMIRESLGDLALEYPVFLTGAARVIPLNSLTLSSRHLTLAGAYLTLGAR